MKKNKLKLVTILVWSRRRIMVCTVPANSEVDVLRRMQRSMHLKSDDPRWAAMPGKALVGVSQKEILR